MYECRLKSLECFDLVIQIILTFAIMSNMDREVKMKVGEGWFWLVDAVQKRIPNIV